MYPAISFRGAVIEINFGSEGLWHPLPPSCHGVQQARVCDVEETKMKPLGASKEACEVPSVAEINEKIKFEMKNDNEK